LRVAAARRRAAVIRWWELSAATVASVPVSTSPIMRFRLRGVPAPLCERGHGIGTGLGDPAMPVNTTASQSALLHSGWSRGTARARRTTGPLFRQRGTNYTSVPLPRSGPVAVVHSPAVSRSQACLPTQRCTATDPTAGSVTEPNESADLCASDRQQTQRRYSNGSGLESPAAHSTACHRRLVPFGVAVHPGAVRSRCCGDC
jgi:hypothetical protein